MTTRFHLPSEGAAPVAPAFSTEWDVSAQADRCYMSPSQQYTFSTELVVTEDSSVVAADADILARQFVSDPLVGAVTIAGTLRGQVGCSQSDPAAGYRTQIVAFVVSQDGATVRGVLYAGDIRTGPVDTFSAAWDNRMIPAPSATATTAGDGAAAVNPVTASAGDRIVVEIGVRAANATATPYAATFTFGDFSGPDLPVGNEDGAGGDPWVEFSANLPLPVTVPPFDTAADMTAQVPANFTFATAFEVTIAAPGGSYTSKAVPFSDSPGGETADPAQQSYFAMWWTYTPAANGTITADTQLSTIALSSGTTLHAYTGETLTGLREIAFDAGTPTSLATITDLPVDAGTTYHLRVGSPDFNNLDPAATGVLRVVGPQTVVPGGPVIAAPIMADGSGRNDTKPDAEPVIIGADNLYISPPVSNVGYTRSHGELLSYRTAWWSYVPTATGDATFDMDLSPGQPGLNIAVYHANGSEYAESISFPANGGWPEQRAAIRQLTMTAGLTYWIALAMADGQDPRYGDIDAAYVLRVVDPAANHLAVDSAAIESTAEMAIPSFWVPPEVVPPIDPAADMPAPIFGVPQAAPPFAVTADMPVATTPVTLAVPPITVEASPRAPELLRVRRVLVAPPPGAVLPSARPVFTLMVNVIEGNLTGTQIRVQYSQDPAFANPTTLIQDVAFTVGANIVRLPAATDLPTGTYLWRAAVTVNGKLMAWSAVQSFTCDPAAGDGVGDVTWTVTSGPTDPHLWFVRPTSARPGDQVTVVGQGFSTSQGTVTLAGTLMPVVSWRRIPATAAAAASQRVIDALTGLVDCEHDQIIVTVPAVEQPGGNLTVTDGS